VVSCSSCIYDEVIISGNILTMHSGLLRMPFKKIAAVENLLRSDYIRSKMGHLIIRPADCSYNFVLLITTNVVEASMVNSAS
jgi:hypothetical protein